MRHAPASSRIAAALAALVAGAGIAVLRYEPPQVVDEQPRIVAPTPGWRFFATGGCSFIVDGDGVTRLASTGEVVSESHSPPVRIDDMTATYASDY